MAIWRDLATGDLDFAKKEMLPKMIDSIFCTVALDADDASGLKFDLKLALEVGTALLLEKPLLILAPPGTKIPARLAQLADAVVAVDMKNVEDSRDRMLAAIQRVVAKADKGKKCRNENNMKT